MTKAKKTEDTPDIDLVQQIVELTADLQRGRADFENYRKRVDGEKQSAMKTGETKAIMKLIPVIDTIERAITHMPDELADNPWASSVAALPKQLEKAMTELKVSRIDAKEGTIFNPELHEAVQFDEEAEGETEVIESELQAGYLFDGTPIRHAMVKVTKK